ncbi:hypothetical protein [Seonamhaeicola maritimus]|uniref:Uncharacterized protein n=1 Tax=Seonamhaeicola maritimus TaxID=2591822 RepID=A0A5C7GDW5_9FLAO|nr:hypothetical protein [Seonamhaeicola maritimus]TXG35145.1 hypothetical protein FUA22_15430 [Seonamhaeicola maritimus]
MKSIKKYIGVFVMVLALFACDEESNFKDFDAALTPVYSLTDISNGGPFKINIYKEKSLIIEYISEVNAKSFVASGYSDTSTDTTYEITVSKQVDGATVTYVVSADKASGAGTLTVDGATVHDVILSEVEIYN